MVMLVFMHHREFIAEGIGGGVSFLFKFLCLVNACSVNPIVNSARAGLQKLGSVKQKIE